MGSWILLAALSLAAARPVAVVIGASYQWLPGSDGPRLSTSNVLRHADEDAWKWAFLAQSRVPVGDILLFTTLDPELTRRNGLLPDPLAVRGKPELAAIEAVLRELELDEGEPVTLQIYISAHGSDQGIHLDDEVIDREVLIKKMKAALAGHRVEVEAVLSDSCYSGGQSTSRAVATLPSSTHQKIEATPYLSAGVSGKTDEVQGIQGGQLSYWLRAAIIGGADARRDGLSVQDISDFVLSHPSGWGDPVFGGRGGDMPVRLLEGANTARLIIENTSQTGEAMRWFVSVRLPLPSAQEELLVPLADIFLWETRAGRTEQQRELRLPAGFEYALWRVPYVPSGREQYTRAHPEAADAAEAGASSRCDLSLSTGVSSASRCVWEPADITELLGQPIEEDVRRIQKGVVEDLLSQHPRHLPPPPGQLRWQNSRLRPAGWSVSMGPRVEAPLLDRAVQPAGWEIGVGLTPLVGRARFSAGLARLREPEPASGSAEVAQARWSQAMAGLDLALLSNQHIQLGVQSQLTGGLVTLTNLTDQTQQQALLIGADLGPTVTVRRRLLALTASGGWSPRFHQIQADNQSADAALNWEYAAGARWFTAAAVQLALPSR